MDMLHHERAYRSERLLQEFKSPLNPIAIFGCGALGANIAESLARTGFERFYLFDKDRIEAKNLGTQPWERNDVGAHKAIILANKLNRINKNANVEVRSGEVTTNNISDISKIHNLRKCIVIDAFDNFKSRQLLQDCATQRSCLAPPRFRSCLHVGLSADYAEVIWDASYKVPDDTGLDMCDYPLARNIVMLAVAVACESVIDFVATGEQKNYTITLKDLAIKSYGEPRTL